MPAWLFYGLKESIVPVRCSQQIVKHLARGNDHVRETAYRNLGHSCWAKAYKTDALYPWLLTHSNRTSELKPAEPDDKVDVPIARNRRLRKCQPCSRKFGHNIMRRMSELIATGPRPHWYHCSWTSPCSDIGLQPRSKTMARVRRNR